MTHRLTSIIAIALIAACGSSSNAPPIPGTGGNTTGGSGGATVTGGTTGSGGATTSGGSDGSVSGTGGADVDAAAPSPDAPAAPASDGGTSSSDGAVTSSDGASAPPLTGDMVAWYECEADGNEVTAPARITTCSAGPCAAGVAIKEGVSCCSGGKKVSNVERGNGKLLMNKVNVPADGTYDVTWWYHCGKNDNFGDPGCGGDPTKTASGCRPHVIEVNGAKLAKVYEFHCFPGEWGELHPSTVPMTLKAGDNTIRIYATNGRDAADLDAIAIYPAGKGLQPAAFGH